MWVLRGKVLRGLPCLGIRVVQISYAFDTAHPKIRFHYYLCGGIAALAAVLTCDAPRMCKLPQTLLLTELAVGLKALYP